MTKYNEKTRTLSFDPYDEKGNEALMARADEPEFKFPFSGRNEDGELVMFSVNTNNITVETYQDNGWIRENVYWEGGAVEELYHAGEAKEKYRV